MALKFFADHCVPTSVVHGLQEDGHTVYRLRDHLPVASLDEVVIAHTQQMPTRYARFRAREAVSGH